VNFNPLSLLKPIVKRVSGLLPDSGHEKGRQQRQMALAEAGGGFLASSWRPCFMLFILFVMVWNHGVYEFALMWQNGTIHKIALPPEIWKFLAAVAGAYGLGRSVEKVFIGGKKEPIPIAPGARAVSELISCDKCKHEFEAEFFDGMTRCPECETWISQ